MTGYRFTPEAEADLFEIWSYIARHNPDAADRVENAIYEACTLIAQVPQSGQVRKEFTGRPVRFWTVRRFPNYIIVYRPEARPLSEAEGDRQNCPPGSPSLTRRLPEAYSPYIHALRPHRMSNDPADLAPCFL
jgi:plasmid stabilization system protein ParE